MLRDAISVYHELLTDSVAADSHEQMERQLKSRGLFFGDRPLVTVLRPRWMTVQQYKLCQERAASILGAFARAQSAAVRDRLFRKQFGLWEWEEALVEHDPGFNPLGPTTRLDAFFVSEEHGLRFTEYNAETPAGAAYNDVLSELFDGLPVMRKFRRKFQLRALPVRANVMDALLDAHEQWAGNSAKPRIAILDWPDVPTYSEFLLFQKYFAEQDLECIIADPRECEYKNGKLMHKDYHITLIYKRVLISELVQQCGVDNPVLQAVRENKVCMVNPLVCKILHKKASLAVLSDERNASLFNDKELEAIEHHIPWTRLVEERKTKVNGQKIDLVPYIQQNKDDLVLKPNDEYGGKGILLGWETESSAWEEGLRTALAEPYIVQKRIALPSESYPSFVDGSVRFADRMMDTAPYAFHGAYVDGCLTRLSTAALLNVTAGGGSSVPTYVIERR
jgi:uncharacterized circularly permuted ATP-grasp superfamily protein